jgi:preprotein translocase SecE subunit
MLKKEKKTKEPKQQKPKKVKQEHLYSPKAVLKEWTNIEYPTIGTLTKNVLQVFVFTGLFMAFMAGCELLFSYGYLYLAG